ncbi:MAG: Branched-chain amino acid ATP-binding cassette transporter, partial [Acidimicrobiaceae bacterium]
IIALELGHPIVEGTPDEVIHDQRVITSYLGGDLATINRSGVTNGSAPSPAAKPRSRRRTPLVAASHGQDGEG